MDKISKLLHALMERTENDTIAWRETVDEDAFQYVLPDSMITVAEYGGTYSITVYNRDGRAVDLVTDEELDKSDISTSSKSDKSHRELMERLYAAARRKALRADSTIDGILSRLGIEA